MIVDSEVEKIVKFIERSSDFVSRYPACSYVVREIIDKLEGSEDPILRDLYKFLSEIWDSSTSTVSSGVPLKIQVRLVVELGKYLTKIIRTLNDSKEYFKVRKEFEDKFYYLWKNELVPSLWDTKIDRFSLKDINFDVSRLDNELKVDLIKIIANNSLILKADVPIFLLRSGFRSFYFINPLYFISRIYLDENSKSKQKIKDFEKFLEKLFKTKIKSYVNNKKIVAVLFQKRFGEDPGTVVLSPLLTSLEIPYIIYDLRSNYSWPKGPMIKRNPQLTEAEAVPLVDLTTTGGTAKRIIEIFKEQFKKEPSNCVIFINRGSDTLRLNGVQPRVITSWNDFTEAFGLIPDVLKVTISSKDKYMGYIWSSIFPFRNYLEDIYLYEKYLNRGKENNIAELFEKFKKEFERFIEDYYRPTKEAGKIYLFGWYDTRRDKKEIHNYLLAIHIFCWNHIYRKIFGEEDIEYLNRPLEYLLDSLEFDRAKKITVPFLPNLLEEKLKEREYEIPLIDPWDRIHRIFVSNTEYIVGHINERLYKIFSKIDPPLGAVITEEQAKKIVEKRIEILIKNLRKYPEKFGWNHPEFGVEGGKEAFEKDLKNFKKYLNKIIYGIVKTQYNIK